MKNANKPQSEQTAKPSSYPQGWFKDKLCERCGTAFSPSAPSHRYCSQSCADSASADRYLRRTYGISKEEYDMLWAACHGRCQICGSYGFKINPNAVVLLALDHDHATGNVRGLLCHNCNRGLGLFQDNVSFLAKAILYLEGATTISSESTPKRVEAHSTGNSDDIVCSAWEHAAAKAD